MVELIFANRIFQLLGDLDLFLHKMAIGSKEANVNDLVAIPSNSHGEMQALTLSADEKVVRRLLRKLDFIVLPTLTVMYIFK